MGDVYAKQSTATVYRALNGRRYLSADAAYNKSANVIFKRHCQCESGDESDGFYGETCRIHQAPYAQRLKTRLVRWMKWRDSRAEVDHV